MAVRLTQLPFGKFYFGWMSPSAGRLVAIHEIFTADFWRFGTARRAREHRRFPGKRARDPRLSVCDRSAFGHKSNRGRAALGRRQSGDFIHQSPQLDFEGKKPTIGAQRAFSLVFREPDRARSDFARLRCFAVRSKRIPRTFREVEAARRMSAGGVPRRNQPQESHL